jgi:ASC-1-like (ASCH) protein
MRYNRIIVFVITVFLMQVASAQKEDKKSDKPVTISGYVMNQDEIPVRGAVFYIDNVRTSYITNTDGSYKIKVSPSAVKLKVLSSEFGEAEILIAGQKKINFTLNNADGQSLKPGDQVNVETINNSYNKSVRPKGKKMNTYNDIYQMIRGEITGVVVNGKSVEVQQGKSFFGTRVPLFVVNGAIVNSIDNINPVEVKSLTFIKGSEAAIYGVNGTNGVISIVLFNGSEKEK